MDKIRKKLIIKAYKSFDNLDISLDKEFYFLMGDYAKAYFAYEEEEIIDYEAFFHKLYFNDACFFHYKGNKQGFYKNYFFSKNRAYLEII